MDDDGLAALLAALHLEAEALAAARILRDLDGLLQALLQHVATTAAVLNTLQQQPLCSIATFLVKKRQVPQRKVSFLV